MAASHFLRPRGRRSVVVACCMYYHMRPAYQGRRSDWINQKAWPVTSIGRSRSDHQGKQTYIAVNQSTRLHVTHLVDGALMAASTCGRWW